MRMDNKEHVLEARGVRYFVLLSLKVKPLYETHLSQRLIN